MTDYSVVRDFFDRPFVTEQGPLEFVKGRKSPVNAEPYTRISTLAGALDEKSGLIDWTAARAVIGLVKDDLEARRRGQDGAIFAGVANLMSNHADPWAVPEGKKPLKELVEKAKTRGGSEDAADLGTAFHGLTEVIDRGGEPAYVPRQLGPWLDAYRETMSRFESVLVEPFVVNDELRVAGSPDRYLRDVETGLVVCADIKSGLNEPDFPMKVTIQVAIGANAVRYDQATGDRFPIDCSHDVGLLIHAPIKAQNPRVDLYRLDLRVGWRLAKLSHQVRTERKIAKLEKWK